MTATKKELKKAVLSEPTDHGEAAPRYWWMHNLAPDASYTRAAFDPTTVFYEDRELIARVLDAYEKAAAKAIATAQKAVLSPSLNMEPAIWDEAVAATLEAILYSVCRVYERDGGGYEEFEAGSIYLPFRRG